MAKAKKLPSGNWRVQASISINGQRMVKSFTATTARKAEYAALEWQETTKTIAADTSNMIWEDAVDAYIDLKYNILSPSTIRSYKSIKKTHAAELRGRRLNTTDANDIQHVINQEAALYSPKTVRNTFGLITAVYRTYYPQLDLRGVALPQPRKRQQRALNQHQISVLINGSRGDTIEIPILLALWMGLRTSEILALTWSDIDFDKNTIYINKALVPNENNLYVTKQTKTVESTRTLHMPTYIKERLQQLPRKNAKIYNHSPRLLDKRLDKICSELGIGHFSFHDLRRSMATAGLSLNIADKYMMQRGGWSNAQTMKNIYQIVLDSDLDSANTLIDQFFTNLLSSHEMSHDTSKT